MSPWIRKQVVIQFGVKTQNISSKQHTPSGLRHTFIHSLWEKGKILELEINASKQTQRLSVQNLEFEIYLSTKSVQMFRRLITKT